MSAWSRSTNPRGSAARTSEALVSVMRLYI
jgi:hypothetical protein